MYLHFGEICYNDFVNILETYMTFPLKQFLKKRCMRLPGTARVRMVAQVVRRGQGQNET